MQCNTDNLIYTLVLFLYMLRFEIKVIYKLRVLVTNVSDQI